MVTVSYPGVYIQEVSSGVHTITGVATSIAAFFGRATKGPMNKAVRLLSPSDYVREFGSPHPKSDLAHSVKLFFDNGGTDCYAIRLAHGARKAKVTLQSWDSQDVLIATAKAEGEWANTVRLEVDYDTQNPDETFNLRVIQEEGGKAIKTEPFTGLSMNPDSPRFAPLFVTQSSELIDLSLHPDMEDPAPVGSLQPDSFINDIENSFAGFSQGRRPINDATTTVAERFANWIPTSGPRQSSFNIIVNDATPVLIDLHPWSVVSGATDVVVAGAIQDKINSFIEPTNSVTCQINEVSGFGYLLTITAASGDRSSVRIRRAAENDISAALMLGIDRGGIEPVRWSNFRPAPTATVLKLGSFSKGTSSFGTFDLSNIDNIAALPQDRFSVLGIDGATISSLELIVDSSATSDPWYQSVPVPDNPNDNNDGVREKLQRIATAINRNGNAALHWRAEVWGYHLAILAKSAPGVPHSFQPTDVTTNAPSSSSTPFDNEHILIKNIRQYSLGSATGDRGDDGTVPQRNDYLGNPLDQTGFHALDTVDLFNLMVIPGDEEVGDSIYTSLIGPASTYCQQHRAFLLIDPPESWTKDGRSVVRNNPALVRSLRERVGDNMDYAAIFYPRLKYRTNGLVKSMGPAGAIAGLMARIDSSRGVWKAPAGIEAVINNIDDLEVNLTDPENGILNKLGVNCLRVFPNGFVNWGARTMAGFDNNSETEWKYIPIRRLALFIEESLYRGTKWVVFEPNDEPLWAKIRLNLGAFMMNLFRQGAFQGTTPNKAFYVKCDGETTIQDDRNRGIVNIEVGFAPLKPAEFVIIRIQQMAGDLV